MNFRYLGGKYLRPLSASLVQTDGSFHLRNKTGYTAALLYHKSETYKRLVYLEYVRGSYEAEWISVYNGLVLSLEKNVNEIKIENDNLGVVRSLLDFNESKKYKDHVLHYKHEILKLANQTRWAGIRWIPRRENRADDLFR